MVRKSEPRGRRAKDARKRAPVARARQSTKLKATGLDDEQTTAGGVRGTGAAEQAAAETVVMRPTFVLAALANPANPRVIDDAQMTALRRSLARFGAVQEIVVNTRTSRIVSGHQRIAAALQEGIAELPVREVSLDETDERALALAMNRIHGEFDENKLELELRTLMAAGEDLRASGFSPVDLAGERAARQSDSEHTNSLIFAGPSELILTLRALVSAALRAHPGLSSAGAVLAEVSAHD